MQYEYYKANEIVFNINQVGEKFYIILEGNIGVYVSKTLPEEINNKDKKKKKLNLVESEYPPISSLI